MRKYIALVLALILMLGLVGCKEKTVNIDFPFEVGDVETIELYRYAGAPVSAEKKVIDAEETIKDLYDRFEGLTLKLKETEETTRHRRKTVMTNRILGTDLSVSALGLGCMGFSHAYGAPTERKEAVHAIRAAFDLGYTLFDTAEVYGTQDDPHDNERLVGEALQGIRDQVQIISKFGIRFDQTSPEVNKPLIPDARPATIRRAVEGSLQRLRTDHIDLYFQHRIDPEVEPETVAEVMAALIREGKITHWGISEAGEDYLRRAHAVCPVTAVENRYSMMARQYESLFPVLEELRVGLVAFSPMANGFLTGAYGKESRFDPKLDYRSAMPQFTPQAMDQNQELLALLRELAQAKNATSAQISLAWMLCKKPWIVPIPGSRRLDRMKENAGAAEVRLTPAEVAALDRRLDAIPMSAVFGGSRVAARGSSGPTQKEQTEKTVER